MGMMNSCMVLVFYFAGTDKADRWVRRGYIALVLVWLAASLWYFPSNTIGNFSHIYLPPQGPMPAPP